MKKKRILLLLAVAAYGLFAWLLFRPWLHRSSSRTEANRAAAAFVASYAADTAEAASTEQPATPEEPTEATETTESPYPELRAAMEEYNEKIYLEEQSGLCDPWSYQQEAIDLGVYGIENDAIGVIEIPSISVSLPIYSGASTVNLNRGAACLAQTSFPIGGENSNAVIAAHRGWNAADYLRDIEEVRLGDTVRIVNYWDTLTYVVAEIRVIEPDDIEQILIQPGRDLLTVFTCHPYGSGGRYRYLLICTRAEAPAAPEQSPEATTELPQAPAPPVEEPPEPTPGITVCTGTQFQSATPEIRAASALPWIGVAMTVLLLAAGAWRFVCWLRQKTAKNDSERNV